MRTLAGIPRMTRLYGECVVARALSKDRTMLYAVERFGRRYWSADRLHESWHSSKSEALAATPIEQRDIVPEMTP